MLFTVATWAIVSTTAAAAGNIVARNDTASGCGANPPLAPGSSQNFTIASSGGQRQYIVSLPATYKSNQPTPLILSFAGHAESNEYQQNLTQLDNPQFNPDHIVVYPQGMLGTDGKLGWSGAPYSNQNANDLVFTDDLLNSLQQSYCVDTSRVFATGKSNGGGFVNLLACHPQSSRFAAFAPVAGAYYPGFGADGSSCKPTRSPQPFLEIHGLNDTFVPYDGGKDHGLELPHIEAFVDAWAARNGCPLRPNKTDQAAGLVEVFEYGCSTSHYAVNNAEHVWESTVPNADTSSFKLGPSAINATSVVMDFFRSVPPLPATTPVQRRHRSHRRNHS